MEAADGDSYGAEEVASCVEVEASTTAQRTSAHSKPASLLRSLMRKMSGRVVSRSPLKEAHVQETFRPATTERGNCREIGEEKIPLFLSLAGRRKDDSTEVGVDDRKQCRICLRTSPDAAAKTQPVMVSPCRCDGTLRYVHLACLTRWIDVSSKGTRCTTRCELCGFEFRRKSLIKPLRLHLPHVEMPDCVLNLLFLFLITIMILCAWVAVLYLGGAVDDRRPPSRRGRLLQSRGLFLSEADVTVIVATILFLAALFLALFTQYRAEVSFLQLFHRFWSTNRNWRIRDYDRAGDEGEAGATVRDTQKKKRLLVV